MLVISSLGPGGAERVLAVMSDYWLRCGHKVPVGDVDALYNAMKDLMANETLRRKLGGRASEIRELLSVTNVMNKWDALLQEVVSSHA